MKQGGKGGVVPDKDSHAKEAKPSKKRSLTVGSSSSDTVAVLQKGQVLTGLCSRVRQGSGPFLRLELL